MHCTERGYPAFRFINSVSKKSKEDKVEAVVKEKKKIAPWSEHSTITLSKRNFRKLVKTGKCNIVVNYKWVQIQKQEELATLYTKAGKPVYISELKRLLKNA